MVGVGGFGFADLIGLYEQVMLTQQLVQTVFPDNDPHWLQS